MTNRNINLHVIKAGPNNEEKTSYKTLFAIYEKGLMSLGYQRVSDNNIRKGWYKIFDTNYDWTPTLVIEGSCSPNILERLFQSRLELSEPEYGPFVDFGSEDPNDLSDGNDIDEFCIIMKEAAKELHTDFKKSIELFLDNLQLAGYELEGLYGQDDPKAQFTILKEISDYCDPNDIDWYNGETYPRTTLAITNFNTEDELLNYIKEEEGYDIVDIYNNGQSVFEKYETLLPTD